MADNRNTSKLHHYVPQSYLRGFANDKHQVNVVPLGESKKPFKAAVKKVAAQKYLYTIEGAEEPDLFEKNLSGLEGAALSIIEKFKNGKFPPSADDRWTLSHYVALQSVRGPDTRKTLEHLSSSMVRFAVGSGGQRNVGDWIKKNIESTPTFEQEERIWQEATQPGGPQLTFSNLYHIKNMVETAEELAPYIATRPWFLVQFNKRSLITSDAPISLIPHKSAEPWEGVGFMTARGIIFPITRKLGILMSDPMVGTKGLEGGDPRIQEIRTNTLEGRRDQTQLGSTAMEKFFNENLAHSAREYIYHHPEDAGYVPSNLPEPNLIKASFSGFEEMKFDDGPQGKASGAQEGTRSDSDD